MKQVVVKVKSEIWNKPSESCYYDWSIVDGYDAPVNVVLAKRGIGKTFGRVLAKGIRKFAENRSRFIYVVETEEMVQELSQNKGEKFFSKIIEYLQNHPSNRNKKLLDFMCGETKAEVTEGDVLNKIKGGTIILGGETAGYMISMNGFAKLKRNNFVGVGDIIIDEFIPEEIDIRSLKNTRKVGSIIQSIGRTQKDIKIWLLGNTIRMNDDILIKLGLTNLKKGEIRRIYDKYGLFLVCHYVDEADYQKFNEMADESVAGRFANLTGENALETNTFKDALTEEERLPEKLKSSHLIFCLHGEAGSVRIHATKDYSDYYVLEDYGKNTNNRFCLEQKFATPVVQFIPSYKDYVMTLYTEGLFKFENSHIKMIFKNILKLNQN